MSPRRRKAQPLARAHSAAAAVPRRVAVVTGAAGALGRAAVTALSRQGFHVYGLDLHRRGHPSATFVRTDVRDETSVRAARDRIHLRESKIEVLVHCAGQLSTRTLLMGNDETFRATFDVDVFAAARSLRAFAPLMDSGSGGRILHVASVAAFRGLAGAASYAASKAALVSLTKSAALELAPRNIQVFAIAPGYVDTPMAAEHGRRALKAGRIPAGRLGTVDEVGTWIAFLCSGAAGYMTGTCVIIDGGVSAT
jgi:NAD(P)-dependent dehydrogenase (short-subunit alcohol dehydrogenase family)